MPPAVLKDRKYPRHVKDTHISERASAAAQSASSHARRLPYTTDALLKKDGEQRHVGAKL